MGTFHTGCIVRNISNRRRSATMPKMLVDTGAEFTWIPERILKAIGVKREKKDVEFLMANGKRVTRSVGFAIIEVGSQFTVDEVAFAEEGDLFLLGARSLEGLNLIVDPARKRLVAAGPLPAAAGDPAKPLRSRK
jgi:predicted aspartyl protease